MLTAGEGVAGWGQRREAAGRTLGCRAARPFCGQAVLSPAEQNSFRVESVAAGSAAGLMREHIWHPAVWTVTRRPACR